MTQKISSSSSVMMIVQLTTIIAALLSSQPTIIVASSTTASSQQPDGRRGNDSSILLSRRTKQTDDTTAKKHRLFQEGKLRTDNIKTSSSEFETGNNDYRGSNDVDSQLSAAAVDKVSPAAALVERTHKEANRGANDSSSSSSSSEDNEDDEDTIVNVNVNVNVHNNEQEQGEDWFEDYKRIETTSSSSSSSSSGDGTSDVSWILEGEKQGHHGQNGGHKGPHYTIDPCFPQQQQDGSSWNNHRKLAKTHKSSKAADKWNNDHYIMWMSSSKSGKSAKSTKGSKGIKCTYPPIVMPSKSPIEDDTPRPTSPPTIKDTVEPIDTSSPTLSLSTPPPTMAKDTPSPTLSGTPIPGTPIPSLSPTDPPLSVPTPPPLDTAPPVSGMTNPPSVSPTISIEVDTASPTLPTEITSSPTLPDSTNSPTSSPTVASTDDGPTPLSPTTLSPTTDVTTGSPTTEGTTPPTPPPVTDTDTESPTVSSTTESPVAGTVVPTSSPSSLVTNITSTEVPSNMPSNMPSDTPSSIPTATSLVGTASPTSSPVAAGTSPTSSPVAAGTPEGASYYQSFEVGTFPFADDEGDPIWSTTNLDAPTLIWEVTDEEAATGIYSLKNPILDNEPKVPSQTNLTLIMPDQGAGALHFSVLAGNQMPFDQFEYSVDGVSRGFINDPRTEWEELVLQVGPGAHIFDFVYKFNPQNIPALGFPPPEAFPERTGLVYVDDVYFVPSGANVPPDGGGNNDCTQDFCEQQLSPEVLLRHRINVPSDTTLDVCDGCTVSMEAIYSGDAWVGIGFSTDGEMIGSEAVIGTSPGEVPLKYNLAGKSVDSVQPMPDAQQTLTDASITVEDGTTILRFTKIMTEPDEIEISPTDNTMLWAYGSDSTLAFHAARDSFTINLSEGTTSSIPPVDGGDCVPLDPNPDSFEDGTFPSSPWSTSGEDGVWSVATDKSFDGTTSLKSPTLEGSGVSSTSNATLIICDDFLGGVMRFQAYASVQPPTDIFIVYIDGEAAAQLVDVNEWTELALGLEPGPHEVNFSYQYNPFEVADLPPSPPTREGAVWIDYVDIETLGTPDTKKKGKDGKKNGR